MYQEAACVISALHEFGILREIVGEEVIVVGAADGPGFLLQGKRGRRVWSYGR